jgi:hypothetical protein
MRKGGYVFESQNTSLVASCALKNRVTIAQTAAGLPEIKRSTAGANPTLGAVTAGRRHHGFRLLPRPQLAAACSDLMK